LIQYSYDQKNKMGEQDERGYTNGPQGRSKRGKKVSIGGGASGQRKQETRTIKHRNRSASPESGIHRTTRACRLSVVFTVKAKMTSGLEERE